MKSIAIYLRVSTTKQNADHQRVSCENYIATKYSGVNTTIYEDFAISGAVDDRPALNKLREDAANGLISHVVTFEVSRLSRDMIFSLVLMNEFNQLGVIVECPDSGIVGFDSDEAQLIMAIKGYANKKERKAIGLRISSGMRNAWREGRHPGKKKGVAHHKYEKTSEQIKKEDSRRITISSLLGSGLSKAQVAKQMGVSPQYISAEIKRMKEVL